MNELFVTPYTQRNQRLIDTVRQHLEAYNISQVPTLHQLPQGELGVFARDGEGEVVAGVYGEYDWGWCFIDTVWTSASVRGQGIGRACMLTLEAQVRQMGVPACYLMTADFQARGFYEKLGYEVFGVNEDRPRGHRLYHMAKTGLDGRAPAVPEGYHLRVQTNFVGDDGDLHRIEKGLLRHASAVVPIRMQWLGVGLEDDAGRIRGGAYGNLFWDVLEVRFVAVDSGLRGMGWGARLMGALEALAQEHGARGISLDTADFQAWGFYEKLGYHVFGELEDRPPAHRSYFMYKGLV